MFERYPVDESTLGGDSGRTCSLSVALSRGQVQESRQRPGSQYAALRRGSHE